MIPTYAVIPTRDRPEVALDCIESIREQVTATFVVNNGLPGSISPKVECPNVFFLDIKDMPIPNIQKLWNTGIEYCEMATAGIVPEWNVLVLNDDVVCPPNLASRLSNMMRGMGADLAYPDQFGVAPPEGILHGTPGPVDMRTRITGYAYMLRGEARMRLDERFGWWYGDDDLDWRCRIAGGSLLVPGCAVEHRFPNAQTNDNPALVAQTALDRQAFINKWGKAPH